MSALVYALVAALAHPWVRRRFPMPEYEKCESRTSTTHKWME